MTISVALIPKGLSAIATGAAVNIQRAEQSPEKSPRRCVRLALNMIHPFQVLWDANLSCGVECRHAHLHPDDQAQPEHLFGPAWPEGGRPRMEEKGRSGLPHG